MTLLDSTWSKLKNDQLNITYNSSGGRTITAVITGFSPAKHRRPFWKGNTRGDHPGSLLVVSENIKVVITTKTTNP